MTEGRDGDRLVLELSGTALTSVVIMAAGVVTGLLAARLLGPSGRGELTASTIWPTTILYAGACGLAEATGFFTARDTHDTDAIFVTAQVMALVIGLVVTAAGWLVLPFVLSRQGAPVVHQARLYLVLFATPCLCSLTACAWLQGAGRIGDFNISRAAVHLVTAAVMVSIALAGQAAVPTFMAAMLVGNVTTLAAAAGFWWRRRARASVARLDLIRPIFSYGIRVQAGSWSAAANLRLDQLLLATMAAPGALGVYVVAVSYASLVIALPTVAGMVMLPGLVRDCAAGRGGRTLATWYRRSLWATVSIGGGLWLASGLLIPRLFGHPFVESVGLMWLLIPASVIWGMNQLMAVGFRSHGRPGVASRAEFIGLAVTVPLLLLVLPRLGIRGAAATSLLAYSCSTIYLLTEAGRTLADLRAFWKPTSDDWDVLTRLFKSAVVVPEV